MIILKNWFNAQDDSVKDPIFFEGFKTTVDYTTDKDAWFNSGFIGFDLASTHNSFTIKRKTAADKMGSSPHLYALFTAYRNALKSPVQRNKKQLYLRDLHYRRVSDATQIFSSLINDLTDVNAPALRKSAAQAFANSFRNDFNQHSVQPVVFSQVSSSVNDQWIWKSLRKSWYDINKKDLDWNDWNSIFYWLTITEVFAATIGTELYNSYSSKEREEIFDKTVWGESWNLNNVGASVATKNLEVEDAFTGAMSIFYAMNYVLSNGVKILPSTQKFLDWRDGLNGQSTFKPIYAGRQKYKDYVKKLDDDGKKALGWDEYFKSDTGKAQYDAWVKAQGTAHLTEDDYKTTATANTKAAAWFTKQDTATKDGYHQEGYTASDKYQADKSAWIQSKDTSETWEALTPAFQKKVAQKMGASGALYNKFDHYRHLRIRGDSIPIRANQVYIKDLRDNVVKTNGIVWGVWTIICRYNKNRYKTKHEKQSHWI